jgi:hypothetical protein
MDRKQFVVASSASAFAALAWLRGSRALSAIAATATPALDTQNITLGIVRAVLPFEHDRFPRIEPNDVYLRMNAIFALEGDVKFASTLALFDALQAWEYPPAPIVELERSLYGPPDVAHDARLFSAWSATLTNKATAFTDLAVQDQRSYLALWVQSSFGVRRRIYQSFKAIVCASAYSMDAMWTAIGYEGPLIAKAGPA